MELYEQLQNTKGEVQRLVILSEEFKEEVQVRNEEGADSVMPLPVNSSRGVWGSDVSNDPSGSDTISIASASSWASVSNHLNTAPCFTMLDDEEGIIIDSNPAFAALFGHQRPSSYEEVAHTGNIDFRLCIDLATSMLSRQFPMVIRYQNGANDPKTYIDYSVQACLRSMEALPDRPDVIACCVELEDVQMKLHTGTGKERKVHELKGRKKGAKGPPLRGGGSLSTVGHKFRDREGASCAVVIQL
jgi:hypothetical protein